MEQIFGASKPPGPDPELVKARLAEEKRAREEKAAMEAKAREEKEAFKRRLRGRRALLSSAGGELGFKGSLGG